MTQPPEKSVTKDVVGSKADVNKSIFEKHIFEFDSGAAPPNLSLEFSELSQTSVEFMGPLPPPAMLKAYEESHPGCAERILRMAEAEQRNIHQIQQKLLDQPHQYSVITNINGAVVALAGIGASAYVTVNGYPWAGAALFSTTLLGIVIAFIKSRRGGDEKKESLPPPPKPKRRR